MSKLVPFNIWLKDARKKLGVTQVTLAKRMSCTQSSIVRIESGNYDPLMNTVGRVCAALKVEADLLVNKKGQVKVYELEAPVAAAAEPAAAEPAKTGTDG